MKKTTRSGSGAFTGLRSTALTTEKMAVLAPIPSVSAATAASVNAGALMSVRSVYQIADQCIHRLVLLSKVHARVERRDLFGVSVERKRLAHRELAETALGRLIAERRIRHAGIDVGIKPVVHGRLLHPRRRRLLLDEPDLDDRFDALEAVLPRDDQAQRRAVLIRQLFPVQTDRDQRQRMHRLV